MAIRVACDAAEGREGEPDGRVFLEDGAPTWSNGYDMALRWAQMELEAAGELRRDAA